MNNKKLLGLIGYPLSHSFSKRYFTDKFEAIQLSDSWKYELFPLEDISLLPQLLQTQPSLCGLNVTIPYKQRVLPYLDAISDEAQLVGAVNTISIQEGKLIGHNTDVTGFEQSLLAFLGNSIHHITHALILGTGGAAKAVIYVLVKNGITPTLVSRTDKGDINYSDIDASILAQHQLIINTTPLGTHPNIMEKPHLPYELLSDHHFLYDLVYNPPTTAFMIAGQKQGTKTINGYDMLVGQAEEAWKIWNNK